MPLPYYPNIPAGSDFKDESQPLMQANFTALTSFGNGYCDLPVVGSQPPTLPLTSQYDNALYTFSPCPYTNIPELYVHKQLPGSTSIAPLTAEVPMTACGATVEGWTMLPSGLVMQWFKTDVQSGYVIIVPPSIGSPSNIVYSAIVSVQMTPYIWRPGDAVAQPDSDSAVTLLYYNAPGYTLPVAPFTVYPTATFSAFFSNRTTVGAATVPFRAQVLLIGAL